VLAAIVAGIGGGVYYMNNFNRPPKDIFAQCRTTRSSHHVGGPFELVDETGKTVTEKDVIDGLTLVYFGYTYCPDVCPLDTARNAETVTLLEKQGIMVKPVFITIDPARDTPEVLADFTSYIHPRMVGLTGTEDQVKAAATAYQVYYAKQPNPDDPEFYLMQHMTNTYLMDPKYGYLQFFDRTVRPDAMAKTVACYADVIANN
jgi:protein SCO1/2